MRVVGVTTLAALAAAESLSADLVSYPMGEARREKNIDHKEAVRRYQAKLASYKQKAEERKTSMSPKEALQHLQGSLPDDHVATITALLNGEPAAPAEESDEDKAIRAVQTLNQMYLNLDKDRTKTETSCVVDLEAMYKVDGQYHYEIQKGYRNQNNIRNRDTAFRLDIDDQQKVIESTADNHKKRRDENTDEYNTQYKDNFEPAERDYKLYLFMGDAVDKECDKGKTPSFVQAETEAACALMSTAESISAIFASPEMKAKVNALPHDQQVALRDELTYVGAESIEESAVSFLQKPKAKGQGDDASMTIKDVSQSAWARKPNCKSNKASCKDLLTIIGEELVCKKKARDAVAADLEKLQEGHKEESDNMTMELDALKKAKMDAETDKGINSAKLPGAREDVRRLHHHLWMHIVNTMEREHECHRRLEEIYGNNYCSCGQLREFMLGIAVKTPKAKAAGKVQDCVWPDKFTPEPACVFNGEQVDCIPGKKMPKNRANQPFRQWNRVPSVKNNTHPLSMPCPAPDALTMRIPCNNFLCPVDCVQSGWRPLDAEKNDHCSSKCTDEEEDAYVIRERTVEVEEAFMGEKCGPAVQRETCINNEECPVDCKQVDDPRQCAEACRVEGNHKRATLLPAGMHRSMQKVWNRVVSKRIEVHPKHGGKECEPEGKHLMKKAYDKACAHSDKRCYGDEVCATEQRDVIIAYECSAGMQDMLRPYSMSQCRWIVGVAIQVMHKLKSDYFGAPTIRISLIKFGNGYADKGSINEAQLVTPFTWDIASAIDMVNTDNHIKDDKWHWGFPNYNEMLDRATKEFESGQDPASDQQRKQSLLVLTRGKKMECSDTKKKAAEMRKSGVSIQVILFNYDFFKKPDDFALAKDLASFPAETNFMAKKGLSWLYTWGIASQLIPRMCPKAVSWGGKLLKETAQWRGGRTVHRGRDCKQWSTDLFKRYGLGRRMVMERGTRKRVRGYGRDVCGAFAAYKGYKGAIWKVIMKEVKTWSPNGWVMANRRVQTKCMIHPKLSKDQQVKPDGTVNDATCECTAMDGQNPCSARNAKSQLKGWMAQALSPAGAKFGEVVHIRTRLDGKHEEKDTITDKGIVGKKYYDTPTEEKK